MSINRKRGSIALARGLCYQINGAADDSDDIDGGGYGSVDIAEILSAEVVRLQEALAQHPPQRTEGRVCCQQYDICLEPCTPRGRHLAQRTWVGLTDEEIKTICSENGWDSSWQSLRFARAIEAKLKEKNS